jgi:hypothetical protein
MANEHGSAICRRGNSIGLGPATHGEAHSVSIRLSCPPGHKVDGVTHLHPGGSHQLSPRDIQTARDLKLNHICIKTPKGGTKCYRFKHK